MIPSPAPPQRPLPRPDLPPGPGAGCLVLFGAAAGALGWGIRGQYGHETGAMIAGLLVGLTLTLLVRPAAPVHVVARAVAWCTVATGFGGSMTYGQTLGLTHDPALVGHAAALAWGMLGLALKGELWIGFTGAFLGMGLGGTRYRPLELAAVMAGLLALFAAGVLVFNEPWDPAQRVLPQLYFSADWRWHPEADLRPRREVWGGLLVALLGLVAYTTFARRDPLARRLAAWGTLAGALGFPLGQSLQAFHAWNLDLFRSGLLGRIDPLLNWWNLMETTFGAVWGGILGWGVWRSRSWIAPQSSPPAAPPPATVEWALAVLHLALVGLAEFTDLPVIGLYTDSSLLLGALPIVAVATGRFWPCLVLLPVTLAPIAGKTVRELAYRSPAVLPEAAAWIVLFLIPLGVTLVVAVRFAGRASPTDPGTTVLRPTLALVTWLYFALNFAFFRLPWPWSPWTYRTPNALIFLACAFALTWLALRPPSPRIPPLHPGPSPVGRERVAPQSGAG